MNLEKLADIHDVIADYFSHINEVQQKETCELTTTIKKVGENLNCNILKTLNEIEERTNKRDQQIRAIICQLHEGVLVSKVATIRKGKLYAYRRRYVECSLGCLFDEINSKPGILNKTIRNSRIRKKILTLCEMHGKTISVKADTRIELPNIKVFIPISTQRYDNSTQCCLINIHAIEFQIAHLLSRYARISAHGSSPNSRKPDEPKMSCIDIGSLRFVVNSIVRAHSTEVITAVTKQVLNYINVRDNLNKQIEQLRHDFAPQLVMSELYKENNNDEC